MKVFSIVILALCGALSFVLADDLLDKTLGEALHGKPAPHNVSTPTPSASLKSDDTATENISALRKEIAALREELGQKDEHRAEEVPSQAPVMESVPRRDRISEAGHLLRPIRVQVEGGGGDGSFFGASLSFPWGWFDMAIRSHISSLDLEDKQEGLSGPYAYSGAVDSLWRGDSYGLVVFQLNPWRESFLAPYLGVGGGWCNSNLSLKYRSLYRGSRLNTGLIIEEIDETEDMPTAFSFNGGVRLNGEKVFLDLSALMLYQSGNHIHGDCSITEICGDLGFYLSARTQLHMLAKHKTLDFKSNYSDFDVQKISLSASMVGVGLSYDF